MAERSDMAERTEPATPKRREDTRRKGQVAQSRELGSVAVLWAAALLFGSFLGANLVQSVAVMAASTWSRAGLGVGGVGDYHTALFQAIQLGGGALLPLMGLLALAGAVAAIGQIGPMFSTEVLVPKASRLSLASGFKRMVEPDRFFELGKALFKVAVVGAITWWVIASAAEMIPALVQVSLAEGLRIGGVLGRRVALASLAFLTVMALIDVVWVRWRHETRIRMSRKEVRDEIKDREGNPLVRSRARAIQAELSRSRMIESVSDASVVITNPTHYAVALKYERGLRAPEVVAKGRNHVAARIREVAERHRVPIVENPPLARLLHKTGKVGQEIPESLFEAVAEVLAYVYRIDAQRAREWGAPA